MCDIDLPKHSRLYKTTVWEDSKNKLRKSRRPSNRRTQSLRLILGHPELTRSAAVVSIPYLSPEQGVVNIREFCGTVMSDTEPGPAPIHCCICDAESPHRSLGLPWNWQDWLQSNRDLKWIPGSYRMPVCQDCDARVTPVRSGGHEVGPDPDSDEAAKEILNDVIVANLEEYNLMGDRV